MPTHLCKTAIFYIYIALQAKLKFLEKWWSKKKTDDFETK